MRKTHIVIHHSYSPDRLGLDWQGIRTYHTVHRGWSDIGYHWGIERVGAEYEIVMGRPANRAGAHAKELGFNRKSFGVCIVGAFDAAPPERGAIEKLRQLCAWLIEDFDIPPEHILGHRDVGMLAGFDWTRGEYKTCPGKAFPLDEFRASLT
jgi:N-acetyl-anhydromuramyl-L-alanine amidase AmpD